MLETFRENWLLLPKKKKFKWKKTQKKKIKNCLAILKNNSPTG